MAASVIQSLSEFGFSSVLQPCFLSRQEEEELEAEEEEEEVEEEEAGREDEDVRSREEEEEDDDEEEEEEEMDIANQLLRFAELKDSSTNRLLRFAELISNDVQRYFGRSQEAESGQERRDIYGSQEPIRAAQGSSGRQRYYDDLLRMAQAPGVEEPKRLNPNGLGPLAELFQEEQRKGRGLPMSQRSLPISFWTEPHPSALQGAFGTAQSLASVPECMPNRSSTSVIANASVNIPTSSNTPVSTPSTSCALVGIFSSAPSLQSMPSTSCALGAYSVGPALHRACPVPHVLQGAYSVAPVLQ
ncbi:protein PERCC1 [Engraulis encrasicolus]|uniref:protein PERCC1 n=1 Tax=Engraulis encrasicolus TaxID=184585 RepID=UPI002FD15EAA